MAAFSLADLTKPLTRAEVQAKIEQILGILGVNTTWWGRGAVVRTMIVGVSAVLAAYSELQAYIVKSGFLDLAEGDWLTLVARYVYGVERIEATFASGSCQLHNTSGNIYALDAGEYIVSSPTTGKSYRNVTAFELDAGQTLAVSFVAVEAGSASNAAIGTITTAVTNLLGVSVTNTASFLGVDEEKDPPLRARCKELLGALSPNGPWDAYAYAARAAKRSTGESAGVTRTRITKDGYGNVTVLLAGASGPITGDIDDPATELGAVDDAIRKRAEPLCVAATAAPASAVPITVAYELWMYDRPGAPTDSEVRDAGFEALADVFESLPIGGAALTEGGSGYVFLDPLRAAISNAVPEVIHAQITLPGGDQALTPTQVATLIHSPLAHAVIHRVTPPEGT